jgi:hypothetical protein
MVDLNALTEKAKDLAAGNADKIEEVVDKVAAFAGDKLGHDRVAPVKDKVKAMIPRGAEGVEEPPPEG